MYDNLEKLAEKFIVNFSGTEIGDFIVAFIKVCLQENSNVINFLRDQSDIDLAEGIWLDYLGWKIGINRPFLASTTVPIFTYDIEDITPGIQVLGGYDIGYFFNPSASEDFAPMPDALFRQRIKLQGVISTSPITLDVIFRQIKFITNKVPIFSQIEPARLIITFGENLDTYEKFLFESDYVIIAAGILLTVEDQSGIIIGEPTNGLGSYFSDYVDSSGLPLQKLILQ